jgi:hypothetical protein
VLVSLGEPLTDAVEKPILVPLTNSLYVPGKLLDAENLLVDVGTGYFVKKVRRIAHISRLLPSHNSVDPPAGDQALPGQDRPAEEEPRVALGHNPKAAEEPERCDGHPPAEGADTSAGDWSG